MIKMLKKSSLLIGVFLSVGMLLSGCSSDQATASSKPDINAQTEQTANTEEDKVDNTEADTTDNTETEAEEKTAEAVETKTITISVLNLSNVQIGMFSVIDPATGEQINLDSLEPAQSVSMDCNWPTDVAQFQWALYNMDGELCIESSTDISQAEKSVALVLSGEDTIEDVQALFDKEATDSE